MLLTPPRCPQDEFFEVQNGEETGLETRPTCSKTAHVDWLCRSAIPAESA